MGGCVCNIDYIFDFLGGWVIVLIKGEFNKFFGRRVMVLLFKNLVKIVVVEFL